MGLKIPKPVEAKRFDIEMKFDSGVLTISGADPSKKHGVFINEILYQGDFDESGSLVLEFEKSSYPAFYMVRMEKPGTKKDQRLGFVY